MLNTAKLLMGIIIFTFFAACLYSVIQYYYIMAIYKFHLRDDWQYVIGESGYIDLFREGLFFYNIVNVFFGCAIILVDFFTDLHPLKVGKFVFLGSLIIVEILIATITYGFTTFFTFRVLIQTFIFFIPAFFIRYFLWGMHDKYKSKT